MMVVQRTELFGYSDPPWEWKTFDYGQRWFVVDGKVIILDRITGEVVYRRRTGGKGVQ